MVTRGFTYGVLISALVLGLAACGDDGTGGDPTADAAVPDAQLPTSVTFADPALEQCVRDEMDVPTGEITFEMAASQTYLECPDLGIEDLSGLEHFVGLTHLSLWENNLRDISPLVELVAMEELQLGSNEIRDLSALATMTSLRRLGLGFNLVRDLVPLEGLTTLEYLNLDGNRIREADSLAGLTGLTWLTVEHNGITDTSVLQDLRASGVETYAQMMEVLPTSRLVSAPWFDEVSAPMAAKGRLTYDVDTDGVIELAWATIGTRYPVVREFSGALRLQGDRVLLETAAGSLEVGVSNDTGLELCKGGHSTVCQLSVGKKTSGSRLAIGTRRAQPLFTAALTLTKLGRARIAGVDPASLRTAADALVADDISDYVYASPNQFDAGSCIFMAHAGAMELLLNQHAGLDQMEYQGNTDLSERYLMNAHDHASSSVVPYFATDLIYLYNHFGGSLLNRTYPFTAGYVKETTGGGMVPSDANDPDAYFSCYYNWFDELPTGWEEALTPTPDADRTSIFVDPTRAQDSIWNVGIIGPDVVERIKYELRTKNAPVIVVYNHYLYWHADIIVGYDDSVDHSDSPCPMVESSLDYYGEQGHSSYVTKIENHRSAVGGCDPQGVFYVRDSIYDGETDEPMYTYAPGFSEKYSKRVITRTYNWVTFLSNHAYSVHRR